MTLVDKITSKAATIGIIGMGYVGLPLAMRFSQSGYRVLAFDIDDWKIDRLNRGESYIAHIAAADVAHARQKGLEATTDYSRAGEADALIICVPTPLSVHRDPDLSFVIATIDALVPHIRAGQVISLESTTYPGTTDEELAPRIESRGFKIGSDYHLVFSPEREDPANPDFTTKTIPKICGGYTPACLDVGLALYGGVIDRVVPVSSTRAAELTKLLENIHRAVNIGLVNEMKMIADRMDIDIFEVIDAAATKPFGFVPYYPGPGLGGHCIPIDPFYLTWKAREYGLHTRFIEVAGEVNSSMPHYVVTKLTAALNDRRMAVRGAKILVLGIAYKRNVEDTRESPSVELMELLRDMGADIAYSDPHVPSFPKMREHHFELDSVALTADSIASYDAILLATNHNSFDYALIKRHARLIVDTRGVYREPAANVVKA